jgi:NAD(P)-dependent dehydrogenase (short-subunit alcohol dehydrogenase family)
MQLNGQSSLVTGGASGLGLAIAVRFLAASAADASKTYAPVYGY